MFGMAMFAIVMGVSLSSCNKDDNPDDGGVVVEGKKLVKLTNPQETFTFNYDDEGRLIAAAFTEEWNGQTRGTDWQYVWGDDAIRVDEDYTLTLKDGLVQSSSKGDTFTYNNSNRITKCGAITAIWDNNKLVSVSDGGDNYTLTYGESCKKGYFPLVPFMMCHYNSALPLFIANPEIVGMRTNQLPTDINGMKLTYEFDKEGYISKINVGEQGAYILTWK